MKEYLLLFTLIFAAATISLSNPADSVTITFRTYKPDSPTLYVPGEFNNWGPNTNGVISPGAPSTMIYEPVLSAWIKTYTFKIKDPTDTRRRIADSVWQYKFYSTAAGWYSDPLNPEQNPADHNNSVLRMTKLFWFQYYAFESNQQITRITSSLIHANSDSVVTVRLTTGQTPSSPLTVTDITTSFNKQTRIVDYTLPIQIPKSYYVRLVGYNNHGDSVVYKRGGYNIVFAPMPSYVRHGVTLPSPASNDSTSFRILVPNKDYVLLKIAPLGQPPALAEPIVMRCANDSTNWWINVKLIPGTYEYLYEIENGKTIYDPWGRWNGENGSRFTIGPEGLTADNYVWRNNNFQRTPLNKLIIYELHLGEFTGGKYGLPAGQGTFNHLTSLLTYFDTLGINAIELMPINDFGNLGKSGFSWGYDVNSYFSLEPSYGTPRDFKTLVDSAHGLGISIIVDVVFNHINETSPLWQMLPYVNTNPYFKNCNDLRYNEDQLCFFKDMDHWTDQTQELIYNVLKMWIDDYKVDGFRYDYTQGIGWNVNQPTKGILGWANRIYQEYNGTIYQIAEHLPESPALIFNSGLTSGWHDSFRDEVFKCLIPSQHPTLATIEDKVLDLGAYSSGDTPSTPDHYANRKEPVNATVNHDEQSLIYEMVTFQGVPITEAIQRDKLYSTFMFTSLGIPMLWQGMEFSAPRGWLDGDIRLSYRPLEWYYYPSARGQSHFSYFKKLIFQRKHNPALYDGILRKLYRYEAEKVLVWGFEDSTTNSKVMALANLSSQQRTVSNVPWLGSGLWYDIFDQTIYTVTGTTVQNFTIPAYTARVFSNKPDSNNFVSTLPSEFKLEQNYPNPFNPTTIIRYDIPTEGLVTLKIYDILGREVATLVNEVKQVGSYEVVFGVETSRRVGTASLPSGVSSKGGYASGVYFYRLSVGSHSGQCGNFVDVKKMLLIR
ncbi:MAG: T9SS type A sorting domain-containing protein [Bacteroidetes bacterium]|nr:T9SS type A sorting domain-containing protein [Bacteroidota bacterium]MBU1423851.1 T9SS type A sorting domain-containing protein [Bacteroidota bacterium]